MTPVLVLSGLGVVTGVVFLVIGLNKDEPSLFIVGMVFLIAFGAGGLSGAAVGINTPLTVEMHKPNAYFVDDHYLVVIWEEDDKTTVLTTKNVDLVAGAADKIVMIKKSYGYNHYGKVCDVEIEIFVGDDEEIKEELENNERDTEKSQ